MNIYEECAKIADELWGCGVGSPYDNGAGSCGWNDACNRIAELIRERAIEEKSNAKND